MGPVEQFLQDACLRKAAVREVSQGSLLFFVSTINLSTLTADGKEPGEGEWFKDARRVRGELLGGGCRALSPQLGRLHPFRVTGPKEQRQGGCSEAWGLLAGVEAVTRPISHRRSGESRRAPTGAAGCQVVLRQVSSA